MSNLNNTNQIPDILEGEGFKPGDMITAGKMNEIIAAIRGTYDILTQPPQLDYNYSQEDPTKVTTWSLGQDMYLYFKFTSTVFGKVSVTVIREDELGNKNTYSGLYDQGDITFELGKSTAYHRYTYKVTAVDANGRSPVEEDGVTPKELIFNHIVGGFEFNTNFNTATKSVYFLTQEATQGQPIKAKITYNFIYVGEETEFIKKIHIFSDAEDGTYDESFEINSDKGSIELNISVAQPGYRTITIEPEIWVQDTNIAPSKGGTKEVYSIYFANQSNLIVALPQLNDIVATNTSENGLTTDSKLRIPYKIQWFQDWDSGLVVYAEGQLLREDENNTPVEEKSSKQLVRNNNSIVIYELNTFPFNENDSTNYKVKMLPTVNASFSNLVEILDDPENEISIQVFKGKNIEFVTTNDRGEEILLASFTATGMNNNSYEREKWKPNYGIEKNNWYFDLQGLSYASPADGIEETEAVWDNLGAGWKKELNNSKEVICDYLHLKPGSFAMLKQKSNNGLNNGGLVNLAQYFANTGDVNGSPGGMSLEAYVKAKYISNINGYNLSMLSANKQYGFFITPPKAGALNGIDAKSVENTVSNTSTLEDDEWIHFVFTSARPTSKQHLDDSNISTIEDWIPDIPNIRMYINGVLVKTSALDFNQANSENYYLFLNNLYNILNSGYESNSKIQQLRIYKEALTPSQVRKNYLACLFSNEEKKIIENRNNVNTPLIPIVTFLAVPNSPNGFDTINPNQPGSRAINTLTSADKKPNGSFPGASKVPVYCKMEYQDNGITLSEYVEVTVQGTSSLSYPIKNYKIKVFKDYDELIKIETEDNKRKTKKYVPPKKEGVWKGDKAYTLKCDYMEHSHKNNTPTAIYYNDHVIPKILQRIGENGVIENRLELASPARQKGYRDAIDGFPVLVYYRDIDKGEDAPPKYVGTYMFNIDKSGLDQGFEIEAPIDEKPEDKKIAFQIPYYPYGYTVNDNKEIVGANEDGTPINEEGYQIPTCTYLSSKLPCMSYEGGTNLNISAATFVSYDNYKYQSLINQYQYPPNAYKDKWDYYAGTLEPRYNAFEKNDINNNALAYSPLDKAITWLNSVWETNNKIAQKTLLTNEDFLNINKWIVQTGNKPEEVNISSSESPDTTHPGLTFSAGDSCYIYLSDNPEVKHTITHALTATEVNQNTEFILELIDMDNLNNPQVLGSRTINLIIKENTHPTTGFNFGCSTKQSTTNLVLRITVKTGAITFTDCFIEQTGMGIADQDFPDYTNKDTLKNAHKATFSQYFSYEYCLAYYLQTMVFAQADNVGKNAMFDTWWIPNLEGNTTNITIQNEDGENEEYVCYTEGSWSPIFPRPYDMDSQMGMNNQGEDRVYTSAEINPLLSPNIDEKNNRVLHRRYNNQYAISFSKLWLFFGYLFSEEIKTAYEALTTNKKETDGTIIEYAPYTVEKIKSVVEPLTTDVIGERYYNCDSIKKYLFDTSNTNYWCMPSGNKKHRYYSFLKDRLDFLDTYFNKSALLNDVIKIRSKDGENIDMQPIVIKPGYLRGYVDGDKPREYYADTITVPEISWLIDADNKNGNLERIKYVSELIGLGKSQLQYLIFANADCMQKLSYIDQNTLKSIDLLQQKNLTDIEVNNCEILENLQLPSNKSALTTVILKDLPSITPDYTFTNSNLTILRLENLGTKKAFSKESNLKLEIDDAPIRELSLSSGMPFTTVNINNCYQLKEFTDADFKNQKLPLATTISITNCPNMENISLPKSSAETITISNCPKLKILDLSASRVSDELNLESLEDLEELYLADCTNLKTIVLPAISKLKKIDVSGCTSLDSIYCSSDNENERKDYFNFTSIGMVQEEKDGEIIMTKAPLELLKLSKTNMQYVKNLLYKGNGASLFQECARFEAFKGQNIFQFTGTSLARIFNGCSYLRSPSDDTDTVTFITNNNITNLSNAFTGTPYVGFTLPYYLARACPCAYNFNSYLYNQSQVGTPTKLWKTWPDEMEQYGFFAIKDSSGNFGPRGRVPINENFVIDLFFYANKCITQIPTTFFKNAPKDLTSVKHFLSGTAINSINYNELMEPIKNQVTNVQGLFYNCTSLRKFDPVTIPDLPFVTNAQVMFYNDYKLFHESHNEQIKAILASMPQLRKADGMFMQSGIHTLRHTSIEDLNNIDEPIINEVGTQVYHQIDTNPLFKNNEFLTSIRGMFASCPCLQYIPKYLFTIKSENEETHTGLQSMDGLFAKGKPFTELVPFYKIKIQSLDPELILGAPKVYHIGQSVLEEGFKGVTGIATAIKLPGGFLAKAEIAEIKPNFLEPIKGSLVYASELFKEVSRCTEIGNLFENCLKLKEVQSAFKQSSIETCSSNLFGTPEENTMPLLIENISSMFEESSLQSLENINLWQLPAIIYANNVFANCKQLSSSLNDDNYYFRSPNIVTCASMFENCIQLGQIDPDKIEPDLININLIFNTQLFNSCTILNNASSMFKNCYSLYGCLPENMFAYNKNLETISSMFENCCCIRGNIPHLFDINGRYQNLKYMNKMFQGCCYLTSPELEDEVELVPENWLKPCPYLNDLSYLFSQVGSSFSILSTYSKDNSLAKSYLNPHLLNYLTVLMTESSDHVVPDTIRELPFYKQLSSLNTILSTHYLKTNNINRTLILNSNVFSNLAQVIKIPYMFSCMGEIQIKRSDFSNLFANSLSFLTTAEGCFWGTIIREKEGYTIDSLDYLPFQKAGLGSTLNLTCAFAATDYNGDELPEDDQIIPQPLCGLSLSNAHSYTNKFRYSTPTGMFFYDPTYDLSLKEDTFGVESPFFSLAINPQNDDLLATNSELLATINKYRYDDDPLSGSYLYQACNKNFTGIKDF